MKSNNQAKTRHPKVIMVSDVEEDTEGVASIVLECIEEFRHFPVNYTFAAIKEFKPIVFIFALNSVEKSIKLYAKAIKEGLLMHRHQALLLCDKHSVDLAYQCCVKGLFDDFFVFKPLYEPYRLKMLVHNAVKFINATNHEMSLLDSVFNAQNEDTEKLIEAASDCKAQAESEITSCKTQLSDLISNQEVIEKLVLEDDAKDLACKLFDPILSALENQLIDKLNDIVGQLDNLYKANTSRQGSLLEGDNARREELLQTLQPQEEPCDEIAAKNFANQKEIVAPISKQTHKHILVVEDNSMYRTLLVNILENAGCSVDQADNGRAAILMLRRGVYDLVLMDLFLPQLNGVNTTKVINKLTSKPPPIVAITGNTNKDVIKKWAELGLAGYLLKPSSREEILTMVNRVLQAQEPEHSIANTDY